MAKIRQLIDKDGEDVYPVVDPTQLHFSGTTDQVVRGDGSIQNIYDTNRRVNYTAFGGTAIPGNTDLNTITYLKDGRYYCSSNNTVATLTNCPTSKAFTMDVYTSHGPSIDDESTSKWCYRVRRIIDLDGDEWFQNAASGSTAGNFGYGAWKKTVKHGDDLLNKIFPVGSIYMSVNSTNPGATLGGTWVAWGAGKVPVGVNTSETEFNTVEKTGGEKTHQLTEAEMPKHRHSQGPRWTTEAGAAYHYGSNGNGAGSQYDYLMDRGGDQPHNNLQPYITCYMWKRTA